MMQWIFKHIKSRKPLCPKENFFKIRVFSYEKSQRAPDWHIKFDIGEELV